MHHIIPPSTHLLKLEGGLHVYERLYKAYLQTVRNSSSSAHGQATQSHPQSCGPRHPLLVTGGQLTQSESIEANPPNNLTTIPERSPRAESGNRTPRPMTCTMCGVPFESRNQFMKHVTVCGRHFREKKMKEEREKKEQIRLAEYKKTHKKAHRKQQAIIAKNQPPTAVHGPFLKASTGTTIPAPEGATKFIVKRHHLTRDSDHAKLVCEELQTGRFFTTPDLSFSLASALNTATVYQASSPGDSAPLLSKPKSTPLLDALCSGNSGSNAIYYQPPPSEFSNSVGHARSFSQSRPTFEASNPSGSEDESV